MFCGSFLVAPADIAFPQFGQNFTPSSSFCPHSEQNLMFVIVILHFYFFLTSKLIVPLRFAFHYGAVLFCDQVLRCALLGGEDQLSVFKNRRCGHGNVVVRNEYAADCAGIFSRFYDCDLLSQLNLVDILGKGCVAVGLGADFASYISFSKLSNVRNEITAYGLAAGLQKSSKARIILGCLMTK